MKHVFFALFDDRETAQAAIDDVRDAGLLDDHTSLRIHTGRLADDDLQTHETDAREGVLAGAILGFLIGSLVIPLVVYLIGYTGMATLVVAAFMGGASGVALGVLSTGLAGVSVPDKTLEGWRDDLQDGKVAVTVTADSLVREEHLEAIFAGHGAREHRKHLI